MYKVFIPGKVGNIGQVKETVDSWSFQFADGREYTTKESHNFVMGQAGGDSGSKTRASLS